jgi:hypothetical protein
MQISNSKRGVGVGVDIPWRAQQHNGLAAANCTIYDKRPDRNGGNSQNFNDRRAKERIGMKPSR